MKFIPRERQQEMIDWCLTRRKSGLLAKPGKGKTGVVLSVLDELFTTGRATRAIICAPLRVCSITWRNQIEQWDHSSWMKPIMLRTPEGLDAWHRGDFNIALINPEMLPSFDILRFCPECHVRCTTCKGKGQVGECVCPECENDRKKKVACKKCDGAGTLPKRACETCRGRKAVKTEKQIARGSTECPKCNGKWMLESRRIGTTEKLFKGKTPPPADVLVWDELSLYCSPSNQAAKSMVPYLNQFKYIIGLTGTPVPNTYMDLWAQARLLDQGKRLGISFHQFRKTFFTQDRWKKYQWDMKPGMKEVIDQKLSDMFLIIDEDNENLAAACIHDVPVTLPAEAKKQYRQFEKDLLLELKKVDEGKVTIAASSAGTLYLKLQQVLSGSIYDTDKVAHPIHTAKLDALKAIRKKHPKESILVITKFLHENERILSEIPGSEMFDEKNLPRWIKKEIPMWVSNAKSLSHGIDSLQKSCRIIVWFSLTDSNQDYVQTNARIHRPGQPDETLVYRILVPDTVDDAIAERLREKDDTEKSFMNVLRNLQKLRTT